MYKKLTRLSEQLTTILSSEQAFAAFSLPGQVDHHLYMGTTSNEQRSDNAFVINSFASDEGMPVFLNVDKDILNQPFEFKSTHEVDVVNSEKEDYLAAVSNTIQAIQSNRFEKAVLSRIKLVPHDGVDLFEIFNTLKHTHPKAFVFLYHTPELGTWCGATPEILLQKNKDGIKTMALAGTQRVNDLDLTQVTWGKKEIHEQKVIEDFVIKALRSLKVTYDKKGPVTIKAGEVYHILSTFCLEQIPEIFAVASALHPGPAICGVPQGVAFDWIIENEKHQREQYCGFIGPITKNGDCHLFINLRSMKVFKDRFALYLGGGITAGSEPLKEWEETNHKSRTLLSVIEKIRS